MLFCLNWFSFTLSTINCSKLHKARWSDVILFNFSCLTKQSAHFVFEINLFCYDSDVKSAAGVCQPDSQEGMSKKLSIHGSNDKACVKVRPAKNKPFFNFQISWTLINKFVPSLDTLKLVASAVLLCIFINNILHHSQNSLR